MSFPAGRFVVALCGSSRDAARTAIMMAFAAFLLIAPAFSQDSPPLPWMVFSAASFAQKVAPDSQACILGSGLGLEERWADLDKNGAYPEELADISVEVNGRRAMIRHVSRKRVDFIVPAETELGPGVAVVRRAGAVIAESEIAVDEAAPALFSLDGSGTGKGLIVNADTGESGPFQVFRPVNPDPGGARTRPMRARDKHTRLLVYGTGFRSAWTRNAGQHLLEAALVSTTGETYPLVIESAGPARGNPGADQLEFVLPEDVNLNATFALYLKAGSSTSNRVTFDVHSTNPHAIYSFSPERISPGGELLISGAGFADGEPISNRNRLVLITPTNIEYPLSVLSSATDQLLAPVPPLRSMPGENSYVGPVQVCVVVDSERVCSSQFLTINASIISDLPPGEIMIQNAEQSLSAALDFIRASGDTNKYIALAELGRAEIENLRVRINKALAGTPETTDYFDSHGTKYSFQFDVARICEIESLFLGGNAISASHVPAHSAIKSKINSSLLKAAAIDCTSQEEQTKIDARKQYLEFKHNLALANSLSLDTFLKFFKDCVANGIGAAACAPMQMALEKVNLLLSLVKGWELTNLVILDYLQSNNLRYISVPSKIIVEEGKTEEFAVQATFGPSKEGVTREQVASFLFSLLPMNPFDWNMLPQNVRDDIIGYFTSHVAAILQANGIPMAGFTPDLETINLSQASIFLPINEDDFVRFSLDCDPAVFGKYRTFGRTRSYSVGVNTGRFLPDIPIPMTILNVEVWGRDPHITVTKDRYTENEDVRVVGYDFPPDTQISMRVGFAGIVQVFSDDKGGFNWIGRIPWSYCDDAYPGGRCPYSGSTTTISVTSIGGHPPDNTISTQFTVNAVWPSVSTDRRLYKPGHSIRFQGWGFPYPTENGIVDWEIWIGEQPRGSGGLGVYGGSFSSAAGVIPEDLYGYGVLRVTMVPPYKRAWTFTSTFSVVKDCHLDSTGKCENPDPTFIQPPLAGVERLLALPARSTSRSVEGLAARIEAPLQNSIVRANVPVFGIAAGAKFSEYRVEYGLGSDPKSWTLLKRSTVKQEDGLAGADLKNTADGTIEGNLANWDTGLKNYLYPPVYTEDHPVDLKGQYTLRLIVSSADGTVAEDRVTVEVGDVIPNAWGGSVVSPDRKARLRIPEQSMLDAFRLVSIRPSDRCDSAAAPFRVPIGPVYQVREPLQEFIKGSTFEIELASADIGETALDTLAIWGYAPDTSRWEHLSTVREGEDLLLSATISRIHACYGVFAGRDQSEGSRAAPSPRPEPKPLATTNNHFLVHDRFESDTGNWTNRDGLAGAMVSLDRTATLDGTSCLRITNSNSGGDFAVNVFSRPWDVREFPIIQFDYKAPAGVHTDFMFRVNGRWYNVGFTAAPKQFSYKRVNIADIGRIENVRADGEWHTARFNLYDMLQTKTRNFVVEEAIMADWAVTGLLKLESGASRAGDTLYIDNFSIARDATHTLVADCDLVLDRFNQKKETNAMGGAFAIFTSGDRSRLLTAFVPDISGQPGHSLGLSFDLPASSSWAGWKTSLEGLDLRDYQSLSFSVGEIPKDMRVLAGIRDSGGAEAKVDITDWRSQTGPALWRVEIPLAAFAAIRSWSSVESVSLSMEASSPINGRFVVDDLMLNRSILSVRINDFENSQDLNALNRPDGTFETGSAVIAAKHAGDELNHFLRITYGGNIGFINAYATDRFSFAGWATGLAGIDCTQCGALSFRIRGLDGGERPNIYLNDGNHRWGVDIGRYVSVTSIWQHVVIPLTDFAKGGVDLSHLDRLEFVFEWEKMSGTVYVDDIEFGPPGGVEISSGVPSADLQTTAAKPARKPVSKGKHTDRPNPIGIPLPKKARGRP